MGPGFCEVCGGYIPEATPYWRLEFHRGDGVTPAGDDVALISSMDCFARFATRLAEHYLGHLAQEAEANGGGHG